MVSSDHTALGHTYAKVLVAWKTAREFLRIASLWNNDDHNPETAGKASIAAGYWLGEDFVDYKGRAQGNIKRAGDFLNDPSWASSYITLTCADPLKKCEKKVEGRTKPIIGGYAWDQKGWFGYVYGHINMCAPYFTLKSSHELVDHLEDLRLNDDIAALQNMGNYRGTAQYMIHEMMHLKSASGPEPHIEDVWINAGEGRFTNDRRAYGPKEVYWLAHGEKGTNERAKTGAQFSTINADSYALLINTLYWWGSGFTKFFPGYHKKGSPDSDSLIVLPHLSLNDTAEFSIASLDDQMDKLIDSYLTADDVNDADSTKTSDDPTESTKSEAPPAPLAADVNLCHGVSGDYWVMSRDVAVGNVEEFCSQSEHTKRYNEGSVNELELSVKKLDDDEKGPQDSPDCVGRFTRAVIDGCDSDDKISNPHNYKFGSTLTTGDGWSYTMTPWSKQVNEVNCDVAYKFWYDGFEVRGKNWPDAKFGANGEGLHDELSGCGKVTKWHFQWTPDDCCFQWYAWGQLPIGTKSCVGRAVEYAGGSSQGHCHGSGRRGIARSDSIDGWPGYGDESRHVFGQTKHTERDSIDSWPGYGDESRHVFSNDGTST